jgi:CRP/FNR family cyclic AMP-dependent transcriptional regulator
MAGAIQSGSFPTVTRSGRVLDHQNAFRNLPETVALTLDAVVHTRAYSKGAVLFLEERPPRGVFILCSGRVRLSITGNNGRSRVLRIADEPGEFLGASAAISGEPYPFMAQTVDAAQLSFIERNDFLSLIRERPELAVRVVTQLSRTLGTACQQMRLLLRPAAEKLAACLLEWSDKNNTEGKQRRLTHEALSQVIGTSRETVSRLLIEWNSNGWIRGTRSKLTIRNRAALAQLTGSAISYRW